VKVADNSEIDITGEITLSCWFYKTANSANTMGLLGKYDGDQTVGNQRSYLMAIGSGATTSIQFALMPTGSFNSAYQAVTTSGQFSANTWVHVVCTYIPSISMKIYVDGDLILTKTATVPSQIYNGSVPLKIGGYWADPNVGTKFNGKIDEALIYSKAITADNVTYLYNDGNGRYYTDLTAFLKPLYQQLLPLHFQQLEIQTPLKIRA